MAEITSSGFMNKLFTVPPLFLLLLVCTFGHPAQDDELAKSIARGKNLYEGMCSGCHLIDGTGLEGVFPPVANSDYLQRNREASIRAIKYGQEGEIIVNGLTYNNVMPSSGANDQEIADMMNYMLNHWKNEGKTVTAEEVKGL